LTSLDHNPAMRGKYLNAGSSPSICPHMAGIKLDG
jgi:hypothetical protein